VAVIGAEGEGYDFADLFFPKRVFMYLGLFIC
jgi:hypothetical protein